MKNNDVLYNELIELISKYSSKDLMILSLSLLEYVKTIKKFED